MDPHALEAHSSKTSNVSGSSADQVQSTRAGMMAIWVRLVERNSVEGIYLEQGWGSTWEGRVSHLILPGLSFLIKYPWHVNSLWCTVFNGRLGTT